MTEYRHIQRWARLANYAGETWHGYYSAGIGQSRDSSDLEASNFAAMLKLLGGESETVIVVRESHWAVGWVEWIAIHESDDAALAIADETLDRLESYSVLDEDDFSQREQETADTIWRDCYNVSDRIAYIRRYREQFEFYDFAEMLACVRGEYFAGYASELIS
jgi:hypothetical protein